MHTIMVLREAGGEEALDLGAWGFRVTSHDVRCVCRLCRGDYHRDVPFALKEL